MKKKKIKKTMIAFAAGLATAFLYAVLHFDGRAMAELPRVDLYRILCDACTVPGLLLLVLGFLLLISSKGALDGVGWLTRNALRFLIPAGGLKTETYQEYVKRRAEKRIKGCGFLFVAAGIFLAAAALFLLLFYTVYQK